jgi:hypothetical protein
MRKWIIQDLVFEPHDICFRTAQRRNSKKSYEVLRSVGQVPAGRENNETDIDTCPRIYRIPGASASVPGTARLPGGRRQEFLALFLFSVLLDDQLARKLTVR